MGSHDIADALTKEWEAAREGPPPDKTEDSNGLPNPQDMLRALHGFTTQCTMNLEGHKQAESLRGLLEKWIESHK